MPLPATMRAMQLTGFGDVDRLQLAEVPVPTPAADELLIQVSACGLNNTDLNLRTGWYSAGDDQTGWQQTPPAFPLIQGADVVGRVAAVGADLAPSRVGQRVMANPTIYTRDPNDPTAIDFIGSERPGGFAEYVCVPDSNVYAIDSALSDTELATFATSYLTAWHMLERAAVSAGDTVLVTGASGGVGSALVQLVRARGGQVIAMVGRGKEDQARALGAVRVIPRDTADLAAALADTPFQVVADVVGGPAIPAYMQAIQPGGRIVTAGAIAGAFVEIDLRTLYLRHLTLYGSTLGTASDFAALVRVIESGQVQPLLARAYPLAALREAQTAFAAKQHFGKIVIQVAGDSCLTDA